MAKNIKKDIPQKDTPQKDTPKINWVNLIERSNVPMEYSPKPCAERETLEKAIVAFDENTDELRVDGLKKAMNQALRAYDGHIVAEQIGAMLSKVDYLSHPYAYHARVKTGADKKHYVAITFEPKRDWLSPSKVAKRLSFEPKWRESFKALSSACGLKYCSDNDSESVKSDKEDKRKKVRAALTDCIHAILGPECGVMARGDDVNRVIECAHMPTTEAAGSSLETEQGRFFWFIADAVKMAAINGEYTKIARK